MAAAAVMATLRATALANMVVAIVVTNTDAAVAGMGAMAETRATVGAMVLVMMAVAVGAMVTTNAAVHLVTTAGLQHWQCGNEVNDENDNNMTTTQQQHNNQRNNQHDNQFGGGRPR
jgi:hypothetical protein